MDIKEAMEFLGFAQCEFEPEDDDYCEKCGCPDLSRLYFRRLDYFSQDGETLCEWCVLQEAADNHAVLAEQGLL